MVRNETRTYDYDPMTHRLGKNSIAVKDRILDLSVLGKKEPKKRLNNNPQEAKR